MAGRCKRRRTGRSTALADDSHSPLLLLIQHFAIGRFFLLWKRLELTAPSCPRAASLFPVDITLLWTFGLGGGRWVQEAEHASRNLMRKSPPNRKTGSHIPDQPTSVRLHGPKKHLGAHLGFPNDSVCATGVPALEDWNILFPHLSGEGC